MDQISDTSATRKGKTQGLFYLLQYEYSLLKFFPYTGTEAKEFWFGDLAHDSYNFADFQMLLGGTWTHVFTLEQMT